MEDQIIQCPKTKKDLCYVVQTTPEITSYFSLSSGFWTNSLLTEGSEFYKEQFETLPELYKELAWKDPNTNLIWLPQSPNLPKQGMVFANGTSAADWKWSAVQSVEVKDEEKTKYPIPNQPGKFYEYRMSMESMKHFGQEDFIDALEYANLLAE